MNYVTDPTSAYHGYACVILPGYEYFTAHYPEKDVVVVLFAGEERRNPRVFRQWQIGRA